MADSDPQDFWAALLRLRFKGLRHFVYLKFEFQTHLTESFVPHWRRAALWIEQYLWFLKKVILMS